MSTQYDLWSAALYPGGRRKGPARLEVIFADGTSGYSKVDHKIVIYISAGNVGDFNGRIGYPRERPNHCVHIVPEFEMLHEMMHERQFTEVDAPTAEGKALYERCMRLNFPGPGHDEMFFTAVAVSAAMLGMDAEDLFGCL